MTQAILKIDGITRSFADHEVLKGVNLEVFPGQHVGIIGNNGQGKTTLMKILLGLLKPDSGSIIIQGETADFPRKTEQKRIFGYMPEAMSFYPNLSGRKTLQFFAGLKSLDKKSVDTVLEQVELAYAADEKVKTYSKGMKQRLGLAQALLGNPKLLLLDEPTNGLDPNGIRDFYFTLSKLQQQGVAILMASHLLAEMEPHLDVLAMLKDGEFKRTGGLQQLTETTRLKSIIRFTASKGKRYEQFVVNGEKIPASFDEYTHRYEILCSKHSKKDILNRLIEQVDDLDSLTISEPGLEELFHHIHES
ncbi:MAG: ABC transporter ATP-binding protein [Gammaproteobacteria bacterium]|nr:ABC transporter ATP-binding protein [Gammaproteobacteria bacterium]MDH5731480.1 ABC transporter ATP-binding protein [Gammaproteobacteria bacterium]